jgi:hypothetical protein
MEEEPHGGERHAVLDDRLLLYTLD